MSAFGRGSQWGGSPHDTLFPCLAMVCGFYLCHWEKFITGCLYLPWIYDFIQLVRKRVLHRHIGLVSKIQYLRRLTLRFPFSHRAMGLIHYACSCNKRLNRNSEVQYVGSIYMFLLPHPAQGCSGGYIVTGIFGVELWHFYCFEGWTFAMVLKWVMILGFLGSIPMSLYNIYEHYNKG